MFIAVRLETMEAYSRAIYALERRAAITVPIRQAIAKLMRVIESNGGREWYLMRNFLSDEPFFSGTGSPYLGTLSFESSVPWPQVDPVDVPALDYRDASQRA